MGRAPLPNPKEALRHLEAWAQGYREAMAAGDKSPFLLHIQELYQAVHTTKGSLELCQPATPLAALAGRLQERLKALAVGDEMLSPAQEGVLQGLCATPGLTLQGLEKALPQATAIAPDREALDAKGKALFNGFTPAPRMDSFAQGRLREALRRRYGIWFKEETLVLSELEEQNIKLKALLSPLGGFLVQRALRPPSRTNKAAKLSQFEVSALILMALPPKTAMPEPASGWKKVRARK